MELKDYFRGKKVLVTGHTGFKGGWLTKWLLELGAIVSGVSLPKDNDEAMFYLINLDKKVSHYEFDILDKDKLEKTIKIESPEIIFHLAAQPIVIESYLNPFYTHSVNYLGTLNLLEAVRTSQSCKKLIIITSDKVYKPQKDITPLKEESPLGGIDPYSASKSAVELLVASYRQSFFDKLNIDLLTLRAGNVIGYGDWGKNRLLPDIIRAILNDSQLKIRNPNSIRPWQDVNDVCYGYLLACMKSKNLINMNIHSINFGPDKSFLSVKDIIGVFCDISPNLDINYEFNTIHETIYLVLDSELAKLNLGWETRVSLENSIKNTMDMVVLHNKNMLFELEDYADSMIRSYFI